MTRFQQIRERFVVSFMSAQADMVAARKSQMSRIDEYLLRPSVQRVVYLSLFIACAVLLLRSGMAFAQVSPKTVKSLTDGAWKDTATAALTTVGMVCQAVGVAYGYKGVTALKGITDQNTRDATPASAGMTILASAGLIGLPEVIGYGTGALLGSNASGLATMTSGGGFGAK